MVYRNSRHKHKKQVDSARREEEKVDTEYIKGRITGQERYKQTIKVWTHTFANFVIIVFITVIGIVGLTSFLVAMLAPLFKS